jgi:hypothetical protein
MLDARKAPPEPFFLCEQRAHVVTRYYALPAGLNVHSSDSVDFLAPMARSSRSVVARSAPMPFSSCAIDLKPLVARGSCSICRSFRFWFYSLIALKTMLHPLTKDPAQ